ncbi:hypothetical protein AG1IA_00852 [Rhizoctonia solani AG-1 IA]|uniref:Uncharacterized protein n=1 Tax=Thanatephorus cucumeris (strain AG1-IA) TaxID=983506 RepID=L8X8Z0_THACA|nr:hypothetical protein AG1IA_00852 [Rhizoctonia solani AG-1 IA]
MTMIFFGLDGLWDEAQALTRGMRENVAPCESAKSTSRHRNNIGPCTIQDSQPIPKNGHGQSKTDASHKPSTVPFATMRGGRGVRDNELGGVTLRAWVVLIIFGEMSLDFDGRGMCVRVD